VTFSVINHNTARRVVNNLGNGRIQVVASPGEKGWNSVFERDSTCFLANACEMDWRNTTSLINLEDMDASAAENAPPRIDSTWLHRVGGIVRRGFAVGVVLVTVFVIVQAVSLVAAERQLAQAAKAGIREAALPKATLQSVTHTVQNHLNGACVYLFHNGRQVQRRFRPASGDDVRVIVTIPAARLLPRWLPVRWQAEWLDASARIVFGK
jgi:hypothetical protein